MRHVAEFDYVIINDEIDAALDDLVAVVRAARCAAPSSTSGIEYFAFLEQG